MDNDETLAACGCRCFFGVSTQKGSGNQKKYGAVFVCGYIVRQGYFRTINNS